MKANEFFYCFNKRQTFSGVERCAHCKTPTTHRCAKCNIHVCGSSKCYIALHPLHRCYRERRPESSGYGPCSSCHRQTIEKCPHCNIRFCGKYKCWACLHRVVSPSPDKWLDVAKKKGFSHDKINSAKSKQMSHSEQFSSKKSKKDNKAS